MAYGSANSPISATLPRTEQIRTQLIVKLFSENVRENILEAILRCYVSPRCKSGAEKKIFLWPGSRLSLHKIPIVKI